MILAELLAYVGLDAVDRERLRELHPVLSPLFSQIADRFYAAVMTAPSAARVFSGPAQVARLHATLIDWMSSGLLGPHDDAFAEKRARIGRRHVQIGLAQHYMFTAMSVVRTAYHDHLRELLPDASVLTAIRAVDKLFDVELALMLRHYQLDSEERRVTRERAILAERILALQTLTAGLAHEVRNPLNAAKLQLELLVRRLRRKGLEPDLIDPGTRASDELTRLEHLLSRFLAFAQPPQLRMIDTDLVAIARAVCGHEPRVAVVPAAPTVCAPVDAEKLREVIQNLVHNALDATDEGGRVEVRIAREDDVVRIAVVDGGAGIAEDVRVRVFEPFFSTKEGRTGLGMSIVHNYVTLHGGRVEIASSPAGTRVDVVLPLDGQVAPVT